MNKSYPSDFFATSCPVKQSAGMIVVKTIVMGPNQPNENTLKRKKTVPPRGHLNPLRLSAGLLGF